MLATLLVSCLIALILFKNKVLFDKDKNAIISFRDKDTTSYVIPDYVTSIGNGAFYDCKSLSSVVIPESVTSIGNHAFGDCCSLTDIVLSDRITTINEGAFTACSSLSNLVIPNSVTCIGGCAFRCCNIPNDLKQKLISRFGEKIFR